MTRSAVALAVALAAAALPSAAQDRTKDVPPVATQHAVTLDIAETIIRDLVQGIEPRRIKIEDILRIVSRHYAVSKQDILSDRRHRSVDGHGSAGPGRGQPADRPRYG